MKLVGKNHRFFKCFSIVFDDFRLGGWPGPVPATYVAISSVLRVIIFGPFLDSNPNFQMLAISRLLEVWRWRWVKNEPTNVCVALMNVASALGAPPGVISLMKWKNYDILGDFFQKFDLRANRILLGKWWKTEFSQQKKRFSIFIISMIPRPRGNTATRLEPVVRL